MDDKELKQKVQQLQFDIRLQVRKGAYWNAAKRAYDLFKLLDAQPYDENMNPPIYEDEPEEQS